MNGPPRLRDGSGPAQRLLRSAALDVPSRASRNKLLAAASTAVVGVVTTSAAAAASTATLAKSVLLYVCVGTIGGGVLALGASEISTRLLEEPSSKPPVRAMAPHKQSARVGPLASSQPAAEPSPVAAEAAQDQPSVVRPVVRDAAPAAAAGEAKASPATQPSLFEEVKLIEAARAAVGRGEAAAALSTLDRYDLAFPRGQFGPEALALRVEALSAAGNSARARTLASEFARRYPSHPLLSRVRAAAP